MLNIAVCDDETIFREDLKEILEEYGKERGILIKIDTFASGKEFVEQGIEMMKYKVVFLDINMDELDGIMTARRIREISRDMFIVFVTAYVNYTLEGYKVEAIRYILKDSDSIVSSIHECLDAICEKMDYKVTKKDFTFRQGVRKIALERILYVESRLHDLEFYVMEEQLTKYSLHGTLNQIEAEFADEEFVRVHQSYFVNMRFIRKVKRYKVVLNNGMELNIAKIRYPEVEKKFVAYRGEI